MAAKSQSLRGQPAETLTGSQHGRSPRTESSQLPTAGQRGTSVENPEETGPSDATRIEQFRILSWQNNDAAHPRNWSGGKKSLVLGLVMLLVINSTMGTALPSNAIPSISSQYGITSPQQQTLLISVFMIGFMAGPVLWGPLSEQYGRRVVILSTFVVFCLWTLACALAPSYEALVAFRFFVGAFASAAVAVVPGVITDIHHDARARGRAMAWFMVTTLFGPLLAPIISGFCSTTIGWRWTFWVALAYAGLTLLCLLFLPETLAPVLLTRHARRLRKADPVTNANLFSPHELETSPKLAELATKVIARPLRMLVSELIVSCTCGYLALEYAIFYMSFQAFPLIYGGVYNLSPGVTGLAFLSIGAGGFLSLPPIFGYDSALRWARRQPRFSSWSNREEARRLPLACLGGPLFAVSLFWLGFSARPSVSVAVPILAGLPFGAGYILNFMALLNYLTDAYEKYAASANAAAAMTRSLMAVVLPLATTPMFESLGIAGACSLLGGLTAVLCPIPFIFIWKGEKIRAGSKFCRKLVEEKERAEAAGGEA